MKMRVVIFQPLACKWRHQCWAIAFRGKISDTLCWN